METVVSKPKWPGARCQECTLCDSPFVPPSGPNSREIHVVGEAPGKDEVRLGAPFVGMSGQLLNKALSDMGFDRSKLHITNAVLCRPEGNRDPTPQELACCKPRLDRELKNAQRVIVMGSNALKAVMPGAGTITSMRGRLTGNVFPTFHPAYILRHAGAYTDWYRDLLKAFNLKTQEPRLPRLHQIIPQTAAEATLVLKDYLNRPDFPLVVDIESEGFDAWKHKLLAVAFCYDSKEAVSLHVDCLDATNRALLRKLLSRRRLIGHNFKFDARFLQLHLGVQLDVWFDTMLAHYLLDERTGTHELKKLAEQFFDAPPYEEEVKKYLARRVASSYGDVPKPVLLKYSTYDVYYTYQLYAMLSKQLHKFPKLETLNRELMVPLVNRWTQIELHGIRVKKDRLEKFSGELDLRIAETRKQLDRMAKSAKRAKPKSSKREEPSVPIPESIELEYKDLKITGRAKVKPKEFNPLSVPQLKELLYEDLELPEQEKDGKLTTNRQAMEQLQIDTHHPVVDKLIEYRHLRKLKATNVVGFIDAIKKDGRIHSSVLCHGTVTGRLAGKDPNLMNVPRATTEEGKAIRGAFVPAPGMQFVQADFRGCELRVLAYYSNDPTLTKVLNEPGSDIHTWIAERVHGKNWTKDQRVWIKAIVFGTAYGRHAKSIAEQLHWSVAEAEALERKIMAYMPGVVRWQKEVLAEVLRQGYLETVFGRRRRLNLVTGESFGEMQNQYLNFKIQSTASDLTQMSMVRLYDVAQQYGGQILMTFHDAILAEIPKKRVKSYVKDLTQTMVGTAYEFMGKKVLFEVEAEVGDDWSEMHKVEVPQ